MTIHIKWVLVISFTIAYIVTIWYFNRQPRGDYGIGPVFEIGFATLIYFAFWIVWLIIW